MPRHPAASHSRVPPHLIQRGHDRDACFFSDEDYALYLEYLAALAARFVA